MKYYETVVLCRREISPAQFDSILTDIETYLNDNKAYIARKENWGLRSLAYKISRNSKAYYGLIDYSVNSNTVIELQRRLRLNEDVVRELTIKIEQLPTGASVIMQPESI